ncbi:MAG: cyclic nucleotide-binding domain-containing protein [Lachnospiraceae bacterium]|nr:cyclic nucleotide-binding domain-containing protein [Lachnospiraceae bacterium]
MTEKQFKKGEIIFREGDTGDTLYQIKGGVVSIVAGYGESDEQILVVLGKDEFFGEMAVIEAYPRSATAVAKEDTTVIEIGSGQISEYFKNDPDRVIAIMKSLGGRLRDLTADYSDVSATIAELGANDGAAKSGTLAEKIKKFAIIYSRSKAKDAISQETLRKLTQSGHADGYTTKIEKYKKGTVIFKEGETGDCMYDVHSGSVGIYKAFGTADEKLLTKLSFNEFFGELGMIDNVKRSGTAVAMEDETTVEIISSSDLKELFNQNPPKVEMILEHISYRLRKLTKEYIAACGILSKIYDVQGKGDVSDALKSEVKGYTQKLYD